jgi:hypothetical protein
VEDIKNASDAMDWAGYQLGKGIPMLGTLALSGGIGGAVARIGANQGVKALAKSAVGDLVKKTVATKAIQAAEGQVVTQAMKQAAATALRDTFSKGAIAGGFTGSFGLEGGLAFGEQVAEGVNPADAVKSAIAVGGINGALEFLPFYSAAKSIGMGSYAKKSIAKVIADNPELSKRAIGLAKEIGGRAAKGAAVGAGAEGITEGLQELVSIAGLRWAENEPLFADLTPEDWGRIKNAAAAGALVGGAAMGAGATVGGLQAQETAPPPAGTPPAQTGTLPVTPPTDQTRTQDLEAMRSRIDAALAEAQAAGNTAGVEELQQIRARFDSELGVETPVQETPGQVAPVQEAPVEIPPVIQTIPPTQEITPPVQETPLDIPPVEEQVPVVSPNIPPVTQPPVLPRPGETVQLKRGEEVILTPPGQPETRVIPTEEEKAKLQQLLGERPTKPEVIPNAEEVQTQTEAPVNTRFSMPRRKGTKYTIKAYHGTPDDTFAEFDAKESGKNSGNTGLNGAGFYFTPDKETASSYGKNVISASLELNNPLITEDFAAYEGNEASDEEFLAAADVNFNALGSVFDNNPELSIEQKNIAKAKLNEFKTTGMGGELLLTFMDVYKEAVGPLEVNDAPTKLSDMAKQAGYDSITANYNGEPLEIVVFDPKQIKKSKPRRQATEATMEEFEAVRKQFQERQAQETPFKNWFGKGTPGVTADSAGTPITLYHGTNNPVFNEWDSSRAGEASSHPTSGLGFFMTADKGAAARYGNNLMALHAKIQNPYELTDADLTSIETKEDAAKLRKKLMAKGYDGAIVKAPGAKPYVIAFDSKQVKFVTNEKPTDSEDFRYSMPKGRFYSGLSRAVEGLSQKKASGTQWASMLNNMVSKGQIKKEELDWMGVDEWLKEQGVVSKEDVLKFVKDNEVKVTETLLGAGEPKITLNDETNKWEVYDLSGKLIGTVDNIKDSSDKEAKRFGDEIETVLKPLDFLNTQYIDKTRNKKWTLAGGKNHREIVITSPNIQPYNTEDKIHYGDIKEGRAIAWIRFNDRTDEDGKKLLFIEEIQSKRHQEGSKQGYIKEWTAQKLLDDKNFTIAPETFEGETEWFVREKEDGALIAAGDTKEQAIEKAVKSLNKYANGKVPIAPFQQTISGSSSTLSGWAGLGFKRMLRYAAENGYDRVGWTTGKQQAERYEQAGRDYLINLYDRQLPKEINKYVKKWGAEVGTTQIKVGDKQSTAVHSVDITLAMKESVMQGQPLFSFAGPRAATADLMSLETAQNRIEKGDNPEVVRQQTGWHQGADKKWRFEISDKDMKWKQSFDSIPESEFFKDEKAIPLSEVIDHPKLFAAYPFLEAIKLIKRKALFDIDQRTQGYFSDDKLEIVVTPYAKDPLSTILHEIQHAIQMYEGFAKGGNENSVWESLPVETKENVAKGVMEKLNEQIYQLKEAIETAVFLEKNIDFIIDYDNAISIRDKAYAEYMVYENLPRENKTRQEKLKVWREAMNDVGHVEKVIAGLLGSDRGLGSLPFKTFSVLSKFIDFIKKDDSKKEITKYKFKLNVEITDILEKIAAIRSGNEKAIRAEANLYEFYKKLAGETEARLTQARQGMTEEERKERSPQSMQEYPDEEQIVVMQGGQSLSAEQGSPIRPVTPDELRANVNSVMGENWIQQAEAAGIIEVIDGAGTRGESGSWAGDKFRLYTQTMPADGSPLGVLLHEGSHAPTFNEILGDSLEGYLKDLDTLAENGNETARNAIAQATIAVADVLGIKHNLMQGGNKTDLKNVQALIEERRPGLLAEEKLAYFIQYAAETKDGAGFLKRLINAIKAWFAQTQLGQALKQAGIGFELNEAMAVEWAKASLRNSLAEAQQAARARELVIAEAKEMPPSVRLGRALEAQYSVAPETTLQDTPEESIDKVRKQYENSDQWMKAPNGQSTNLNERQWLQVRTPEFKAWFGNWENDQGNSSKILDDNGEPLVVYHGTQSDFSEFDLGKVGTGTDSGVYGKGFYFTSDPKLASVYTKNYSGGNVIPVFLNMQNPAAKAQVDFTDPDIRENLKQSGYDGVIVKPPQLPAEFQNVELFGRKAKQASDEYVVYDPNQIKSAIANIGLFSSTDSNILYSIGLQEFKDTLWTDPTDSRQDFVNKPGLLQKFRANFIDFFAEMEKKSTRVYDAYSLLRNKKAARLVQARQEYMFPLRDLIAKGPWTSKEVGDMLAARHLKVDNVNTRLAERSSYSYTKELLKALPESKKKELMKARSNVKGGKMPDGSVYLDINGTPAKMSKKTKQKLMFDLMNKYVVFEQLNPDGKQALRFEWEVFKDAAGGFSNGGIGKGIVRSIDDVLADTSKDQARFDKIANLFDAMNRHALQIREDGELITPEEHARLLLDKTTYAPLRRESYNVDREIEQLFQRAGQGGSKQLGVRTGTTALSEPTLVLQNALAALEASAAAAERNLANKELYEVVNADKESWKPWFAIVDADKYITHDEDGFLQERNATASNRADITLINKGKKLVIRPNMHNERAMGFVRAANNLDAQIVSGPMSVLNFFNNIVRWVNVTASPAFLMMNAIRDPGTALYNLQATEAAPYTSEIFANYGKSFNALKKVFLDGNRNPTDADVKMVEAFENAGGRTSFIEQLNPSDDTWRSFDAQVARRQGGMKQIMAAKDKWIDGLENFNVLFENVMRLSTFNVLMDKGVDKTRAARIAQDLTTNFTRRGYKTQALGNWWVFFNAAVQGNYQVLRNLMASKKLQAWAGGTIMFALMLDLLGRAVADDWDEIPEWDKERFIILPIKVAGDFVKIPAPWVYNVLWRTGGMFGETLAGVRKPQNMILDLAALTAVTFNPLGKPGSIAQAISPTAADPFVQILENKDFAGNPIGPEGFPGAGSKANSELLWSSTPKGYQSVARFVNELTGGSAVESGAIDLRPGDYQLLAKFLTGSLGRFLSDATFGLQENLEKGIEGPKEIPIVKEFFSEPYNPMRSQTYHTNIAAVYGAHKLEKMYRDGPERDLVKLQEVRQARSKDLRMYSQAQDVERQIKSLRVRIRAAENRKDDARVKELRGRIEAVQERFNAAYKQRVS